MKTKYNSTLDKALKGVTTKELGEVLFMGTTIDDYRWNREATVTKDDKDDETFSVSMKALRKRAAGYQNINGKLEQMVKLVPETFRKFTLKKEGKTCYIDSIAVPSSDPKYNFIGILGEHCQAIYDQEKLDCRIYNEVKEGSVTKVAAKWAWTDPPGKPKDPEKNTAKVPSPELLRGILDMCRTGNCKSRTPTFLTLLKPKEKPGSGNTDENSTERETNSAQGKKKR